MTASALEVRNLTVFLEGPAGLRRVLDRVSLRVQTGRTFALLGESGSGKTVLFHSVLGLHPGTPGVVAGEVELLGVDVFQGLQAHRVFEDSPSLRVEKDVDAWTRGVRRNLSPLLGRAVTLVPQDPLTSLPPFYRVGRLIEQALRMGASGGGARSFEEAPAWLERVHLNGVEDVARRFVHELSGGMAQRVALALALAPRPKLVVADEPTTGLDATLRVKILDLLASAVGTHGVTLCLITHDMEAARLLACDVAVLCLGRVVEAGPAAVVLRAGAEPKHPYTAFLLDAERRLAGGPGGGAGSRDEVGPAELPVGGGCVYRPRCPLASTRCEVGGADLEAAGPDHWIACGEALR